jgi:hypothetical protein
MENIAEAIEVCYEEAEDEQTIFVGIRDIEIAI